MAGTIQRGWRGFKFRRTLHGESMDLWNNLKGRRDEVEMGNGTDRVEWTLSAGKKFYVKSLYRKVKSEDCKFPHTQNVEGKSSC